VVLIDRESVAVERVAGALGGRAESVCVDVVDADAFSGALQHIEQRHGRIDLFASNAGIAVGDGLATDAEWERSWRLHVMAHVYAARAVLPGMVRREHGHFLITASAAGLLTEMDSATYAVTKHGSVALAEWLAINYGGAGVGFSCLCPQAVRTPMVANLGKGSSTLAAGPVIEPSAVADAVVEALACQRFLILPHPEVALYEQRRVGDRDRWLSGMRKVRHGLSQQRANTT